MSQRQIINALKSQPAFEDLLAELRTAKAAAFVGLPRSARLPAAVALQNRVNRTVLLITARSDRALVLKDEWGFWEPDLKRQFFPEPDPLYYEPIPWSRKTRRDRVRVLALLAAQQVPTFPMGKQPPVILAPARAVITRTLPRREFIKASRRLNQGDRVSISNLAASWLRTGYQPSPVVVAPGEFARRGGILDIWPPADRFPARLEFFGDEIDMLRRFDPSSQRTIEIIEELLITPAREFLLPEGSGDGSPGGEDWMEADIPALYRESTTLLNFLPSNALILLDDRELIRDTIQEIDEQAGSLHAGHIRDGTLPDDAPRPYLNLEEFEERLLSAGAVSLGPLLSSEGPGLSRLFASSQRFGGELKAFMAHLGELVQQEAACYVVSRQASRLQEIWQERTAYQRSPVFIKGNLEGGWILKREEGNNLYLFTDGEIFGWGKIQPRQQPIQQAKAPELDYSDFQEGDWVVHVDHGIGRFAGLVRRQLGESEGEYLAVEYAEGDRLFVPVPQADRIARYVGPDHHHPRITRLGSKRWSRIKKQVREEVQKVAADLLKLYAHRETMEGHAFSPDSAWQQELEASFPYIETEDQLRVLTEVKRDMEKPKPMDRLICGDVGYGKTEIAVRAAFKAVMDGKQVAVLVPTTVLAQQHYETFTERMSAFPVEVCMLSRFQTPKEQTQILSGLVSGAVDVVIGTHRLLSSDVYFHDLGLLIVDEEQRFGVGHKEKIKRLRTNIDVLTMTATPIPRTMYMALTGIRDISRINTPPEERLPVVTRVSPYDPELIQKAIWRELERGGQVFFVHNRVRTIDAMKSHLSRLVPQARVGIAHGQMAERELAERMREFTAGEIDVLLSTSIIESGLDIPNANTIIIDQADRFGLAQLYQLRGRVGRGAQRAYAYFFKQRQGAPTPEGRLRLETIAEHTQLGAGYSVAMRDLEIRGAGDILGTRQHGNIAAVGFHLYTQLLAQAVCKIQDPAERTTDLELEFPGDQPPVRIDLPLTSGIPEDYIADQSVRLSLYRRMAGILKAEEIEGLKREFKDRFGSLPVTVENLFLLLRIKLLAEEVGLESISLQRGQLLLQYPEEAALPQPWMVSEPARFGESSVWLKFNLEDPEWDRRLLTVLEALTPDL